MSRSGKILVYYPSRPNLERGIQFITQCYVPVNGQLNLCCEGPIDPLDRAFEFTITANWMGTGMKCAEAKTHFYQWLDPKTGDYIFQLPDKDNRVAWLGNEYIYQGCVTVRVTAIDRDDERGKRIITAERLVWKGVKELRRIAREHPRLTKKDIEASLAKINREQQPSGDRF